MIGIVDYGMGNLKSVYNALRRQGVPEKYIHWVKEYDKKLLKELKALILPGVGAFKKAMENLRSSSLDTFIKEFINSGKPFLGICLGFQLLFDESEEIGWSEGLGILRGKVVKFKDIDAYVPHIGWNQIYIKHPNNPILKGVPDGAFVYFVHSYYPVPEDEKIITTITDYGGIYFTSGIWKDNIYAFQFHPEKSQKVGQIILKNFLELVEKDYIWNS